MATVKVIVSKSNIAYIARYLKQESKTNVMLKSGIECSPENVKDEFQTVKQLYNKTDGIQYYHMIQSFKPGEVTPEKAHDIGIEWAKKNFKGYQCFVVTHQDKDHIHNHVVINSVGIDTGKKFQSNKHTLNKIRKDSDRICAREQLSVVQKKEKGYNMSQAEYNTAIKGQSWKIKLMQDIKSCIKDNDCTNKGTFIKKMQDKGYKVNWTDTRKYITYTTPEGKKCRDRKLMEQLSKENLEKHFKQKSTKKEKEDKNLNKDKQLSEAIEKTLKTSKSKREYMFKIREHGYYVNWKRDISKITYRDKEGFKYDASRINEKYDKKHMEKYFKPQHNRKRVSKRNKAIDYIIRKEKEEFRKLGIEIKTVYTKQHTYRSFDKNKERVCLNIRNYKHKKVKITEDREIGKLLSQIRMLKKLKLKSIDDIDALEKKNRSKFYSNRREIVKLEKERNDIDKVLEEIGLYKKYRKKLSEEENKSGFLKKMFKDNEDISDLKEIIKETEDRLKDMGVRNTAEESILELKKQQIDENIKDIKKDTDMVIYEKELIKELKDMVKEEQTKNYLKKLKRNNREDIER